MNMSDELANYNIHEKKEILRKILRDLPQEHLFDHLSDIAPEIPYPSSIHIEKRIESVIRWNAVMMVLRANQKDSSLGGHLSTYASAATLYEVGFNHFFKTNPEKTGDMLFVQGHASPGIYARAYIEGRLTQNHLDHFRQEITEEGLSSYPHPYTMPEFWQVPTVSMGLSILQAIYQARLQKYLQARGIIPISLRKIWVFAGDGEMDSVESTGALSIAASEKLDNLILVINCNLLRLDGLVCGNTQIVQKLQRIFAGAGWKIFTVLWGEQWDSLFQKDKEGHLQQWSNELCDGMYQTLITKPIHGKKAFLLTKYPQLIPFFIDKDDAMVHQLLLNLGGHSHQKIYSAYAAACQSHQPTVILARTVKGYLLGDQISGHNIAHQAKKMSESTLISFAKKLNLSLGMEEIKTRSYCKPTKEESVYIQNVRQKLGGFLPQRRTQSSEQLKIPSYQDLLPFIRKISGHTVSTTVVFVRLLQQLLCDKNIGKRIIPIIADEGRTFGFEGLISEFGIYAPTPQAYEPADGHQLLCYKETIDGVILQEGISESGAISSWIAAATAYSNLDKICIPFYIYYAMFGMQRVGDMIWAAADQYARGFLIGGLAGRTTLSGEGLQHQDGHNPLFFSVISSCCVYTPAFGYELVAIVQHGLERMVCQQENIFYYMDVMNENYVQPPMPDCSKEGIIKGMYVYQEPEKDYLNCIQLLGSGALMNEIILASQYLQEYQVGSVLWSVTSFSELRKEALAIDHYNQFHKDQKKSYCTTMLEQYAQAPTILAVTDYVRLMADQIRAWIPSKYTYCTLGTDGFGRSDTRTNLRQFFQVNHQYIVYFVLKSLYVNNKIEEKIVQDCIHRFHIKEK